MVDAARLGRMAADDGEIGLVDPLRFEGGADGGGSRRIEGEEQHAGRAAIEAVRRVDALPDLVAHDLQRETRFVAVEHAAVHEQAGRLVHGDQRRVAVEHRQRLAHAVVLSRACPGNSPST